MKRYIKSSHKSKYNLLMNKRSLDKAKALLDSNGIQYGVTHSDNNYPQYLVVQEDGLEFLYEDGTIPFSEAGYWRPSHGLE